MKIFVLLAAVAAVTLTSASAEARDGWFKRRFIPWTERNFDFFDDEEPSYAYYSDEDETEYYTPRRRHRARDHVIESETESEEWWLDDGARNRLESRQKARKQALKKPNVKKVETANVKKQADKKPKVDVAEKPAAKKSSKPKEPVLQTASLAPVKPVSKPKSVAKSEPEAVEQKAEGKTIGCTAGAAVIVGYGFGDVKPKACTGNAYAYSATRAGKSYEIKLTAASGEITDVKKLN
jgi:hypothetical protein